MASWILNFTKARAKPKTQMPQDARHLLELGLWGVPATAQAKEKIATGDRVLAYVGAPDRVIVGDATVASVWHDWTPDEAAQYPLTGTFAAGIALRDAHVWSKPLPLSAVWTRTEAAKTNPSALLYGAAVRLPDSDFNLILGEARATGSTPPYETATGVPEPAPSTGGRVGPAGTRAGVAYDPPMTNNHLAALDEPDVTIEDDIEDLNEAKEVIPYNFEITSYGADYDVDGLVKRLKRGDIVVPTFDPQTEESESGIVGFQRRYWRGPRRGCRSGRWG